MPNPLIISKIKLPSGNTYEIQDAGARELIAALEGSTAFLGLTTTALTDGATTNPIMINGTSTTATTGNIVVYDNAEFIWDGAKWIEFGDLSNLGALAYKDTVSLSKGAGDNVLGEATTFNTNVTPTLKYLSGIVGVIEVGADGTSSVVKSYPGATSKLATTTVPNVTSAGSASSWQFAMGTGDESETLIISGANSVAPTLGTAKTVATGALAANGAGDTVMTGLGTPTTETVLTGVQVTQQPTFHLVENSNPITPLGTDTPITVQYVKEIASASTTAGTNDKVKVAKFDDLSVSTS